MGSAFDLTGLRILITGAAGGIGATTAQVCASLGAEVLLVDRRATGPLAQQLRQGGAKAAAFVCDVTSRAEVERVADRLEAGMVFVNAVGAEGVELPFGGVKRSGFGRELGRFGIDEFVNKKLIRIS